MPFTSSNDLNILQATDTGNVGAGAGDDVYIITPSTMSSGQVINLTDNQGVNSIWLLGGVNIARSIVAGTAVQLILDNGAIINVFGADGFNYQLGGNPLLDLKSGVAQSFATFATNTLGAAALPSGTATLSGSINITINNDGSVHKNAPSQPSHQPTAQEQFMLELLNRARMNPVEEASLLGIDLNEGLAAGTLSTNPRQPLAFNNELTAAARSHSQDMVDNDFFAHTNLAGKSTADRIQATGYTYTTFGENIAYVGTTAPLSQALINTFVQDSHEDLFVDEGIIGRGHRINMLNANFKEIGIGIVDGSFNNGNADFNVVMSTQNFATQPNAKAILLGVIYADADNNAFYTPGEGIGDVSIVILNTATNTTQTLYSMTAGGYQVALQTGVYDITYTFDGNTQFVNDLVIGIDNVKSDWLIA
ncbi:MAG: CAP domain-containing protein [Candidatus Thiothrix sulfatifontis]|nr:MAG: CAP domain-containing protein [Candidatus Thiothrix sulfatifontis]